jgi:hypothetical protein
MLLFHVDPIGTNYELTEAYFCDSQLAHLTVVVEAKSW